MCAIYGFTTYKKVLSNGALKKLIKRLSIEAEVRGTHATGISYVKDENVITYKKPKPAHKVKLKFPKKTKAVIGHTRYTTQGSEKLNYNNHPFNGECNNGQFALAHNGVLWNDKELRKENNLPLTHIETDSYIAVQLIEQQGELDFESLKYMAESIQGSFMLTILREDNTLFLVKGSNPITIYHFPELGLYVYASTEEILKKALSKANICGEYEEVNMDEGDIISISPNGEIERDGFNAQLGIDWDTNDYGYNDYMLNTLAMWFDSMGYTETDLDISLMAGYEIDDIWDMVDDTDWLDNELYLLKMNCGFEDEYEDEYEEERMNVNA